uniref:Magnesium transporter MRS2-F isoform X2 n=1 Tax=Tanacetum cinerariifolium TaxID=118510 RepID=A0A699I472_TANCI|nr:magnesium transporter MRS2-F isoform X2 [Tanacetum cinerariifolium]
MELLDADANGSIEKDEFKPKAKRWVEVIKQYAVQKPKKKKVEVDILDEMGIVGESMEITDTLVAISGRVQKVRDELKHLLDDDGDMAEMYLTDKLMQQP